jgi:hypothetical protein
MISDLPSEIPMRRHLLLLALAVGLLAVPVRAEDGEETAEATAGIAWAENFEAAKEKAQAENKALFLYLTPSWFT